MRSGGRHVRDAALCMDVAALARRRRAAVGLCALWNSKRNESVSRSINESCLKIHSLFTDDSSFIEFPRLNALAVRLLQHGKQTSPFGAPSVAANPPLLLLVSTLRTSQGILILDVAQDSSQRTKASSVRALLQIPLPSASSPAFPTAHSHVFLYVWRIQLTSATTD
jgi:hypothetical protein